MGFRFRKSIKIAPGVRVNVGSKSVGVSAGVKGARISTNTRTGTRATVSAPGTGLSYSTKIGGAPRRSASGSQAPESAYADEEAYRVQVNANVVLWPCLCACCGQKLEPPIGATDIGACHVVKLNAAQFDPPYCESCERHIELHTKWEKFNHFGLGCTITGCVLAPILLIVSWAAITIATSSLSIGTVVSFALTIGLIAFAVKSDQAVTETATIEKDQLAEVAQQAMGPNCIGTGMAAWLESSQGSFRVFGFRSESLAKLFAVLNKDKVVH